MASTFGNWLWIRLVRTWRAIADWLGPTAYSVANHVNRDEVLRILILALSSGTFAGAIEAVLANLTTLFNIDATTAGTVAMSVTAIVGAFDYVRRRGHAARWPRGVQKHA